MKQQPELECYQLLAGAIIIQAVTDYRKARKRLKKDPTNIIAKSRITEIESFFNSKWFLILSNIDGKYIIDKLRKE